MPRPTTPPLERAPPTRRSARLQQKRAVEPQSQSRHKRKNTALQDTACGNGPTDDPSPSKRVRTEKKAEAIVSGIALESAINSVAERVNYGIDWAEKTTAPLSVWRWEVKDNRFELLPKAAREKIEIRLAERQQVSSLLPS